MFSTPRSQSNGRCRWNGTTENSHDAYFRATKAGLESIETDIHLSLDSQLPMIHDNGLGRSTDVGEHVGATAYNPYTGQGYNPAVIDMNCTSAMMQAEFMSRLPTLPDLVTNMYHTGTNVLQLDFKDKEAVAPAYWALMNLTNAASVPANEWCIYKLQASWWNFPAELEALDWMQDAFAHGVKIAYIPVYTPVDEVNFNTLASLEAFMEMNYAISAEIELYSNDGPLQGLLDYVESREGKDTRTFNTSGIL